ncbi:HECT-domain-containing protein [Aaosphaeria arxii CBS 175.79]|uniref:HECT-type E3 ubiquitin transferase n=1 Tax=Aaosphaeria arxii CBS 175.79 TaxID=1450172 RepID=A0A6A5Y6M1_9PLEO|nr:HECT-domain-containing protein [Aaosphaeria arxii CBS 175.79]KAF2020863.1 HECT-domain-containing protein [Aaosphaeria arxii CBS 175.79]
MCPSRGHSHTHVHARTRRGDSNKVPSSSHPRPSSTPTHTIRTVHRPNSLRGRWHGHVMDVDDVGRIFECVQVQRQAQFQHVVRRYLSQILYGCKSAYCTTPTCLSCNRRLATRPHRAPTQLTARALAHFLASQDDPYRGLCTHQLKVSPDTFEIDGSIGTEVGVAALGQGPVLNLLPLAGLPLWSTAELTGAAVSPPGSASRSRRTVAIVGRDGTHDQEQIKHMLRTIGERHQVKKDVKSLGQSLYDTVTVIYAYSKQLPTASSVLSMFSSRTVPQQTQLQGSDCLDSQSAAATPKDVLRGPTNVHSPPPRELRTPRHISMKSNEHCLPAHNTEISSNGDEVHTILHRISGPTSDYSSEVPSAGSRNINGNRGSDPYSKTAYAKKSHSIDMRGPPEAIPIPRTSSPNTDLDAKKSGRSSVQVTSHLTCDILEQLKGGEHQRKRMRPFGFVYSVDYEPNKRFRPTSSFVSRSLFHTLSNPELLLKSFRDSGHVGSGNSKLSHMNSSRMTHAFRDWKYLNGALIYDSLWVAVESLFVAPPELDVQKGSQKKSSQGSSTERSSEEASASEASEKPSGRYLNDEEAAHIIMICIHALTSLVSVGWPRTWVQLRNFRSWGIVLPHTPDNRGKDVPISFSDPWLAIIDELEYEPAVRLADRLLRGIGARLCFEQILATMNRKGHCPNDTSYGPVKSHLLDILVEHLAVVEHQALASKRKFKSALNYQDDPGWTVTATFMEWLRTLIIKQWDGKVVIHRWSSVGVSLAFLERLHRSRDILNLRTRMFYMPWFDERIDKTHEPVEYLQYKQTPNSVHLLQFPCLFQPEVLIGYFRTINFTSMYRQFEGSERTARLQRHVNRHLRFSYANAINKRLAVVLSNYLVLEVGREHPLEDTLNQLWGQERRLLLKPLKVKMGKEEGEIGHDQGGITYEFFRVVLGEAFKPDNGMFEIDPQTRMTWFQPASLEPDWKFEMLGLLFSLALYNGVTLPVTFPIALYHSILTPNYPSLGLDASESIDFIQDGWPILAKSLRELLSWKDGDVADIFLRSYTFSFEACGQKVNVDMNAFDGDLGGPSHLWPADLLNTVDKPISTSHGPIWPSHVTRPPISSPAWERPFTQSESATDETLVTNANREHFVKDYISWLTYKSVAPQLLAFRKGFNRCLHSRSLHLFDPPALQNLLEGRLDIDVDALQSATRYEEGYSINHPTIQDFWTIVESYDMDDRRKLLEFVTASERVPVTGFETMNFHIVRNGSDTDMLPTSSTCFGKLMLPEYADRDKLKRKLDLAIQNSKGFGVL